MRNKYANLGLGDQMIGAVAEMVAATVPAGGDVAGAVASAETFLNSRLISSVSV